MKYLLCTVSFCMVCFFSKAQPACSDVKYIDKLAMGPNELPIQDFKKYLYNLVPDSVKDRLKEEIIKETSAAFYKDLHVKSVKLFDSAVNEKLFQPVTIADDADRPVDFLYVFFYEMMYGGNVPFTFKLEVKKNGELLKKGQFEGILNQKKKLINCAKALSIAAIDKEAPITKPGDIFLYYNDTYKTIVWQIMEADNSNGDSQHVTVINAFTGDIVEKNEFLKGSSNF